MSNISTLLFLFVLFNITINAQHNWSSSSKKAIQKLEAGRSQMYLGEYNNAIELINASLKADRNFVEAYLILGQLYEDINDLDNAIAYYIKGHELNPGQFSLTLMNLARAYYKSGDYKNAKVNFDAYLAQENVSTKNRSKAIKYLKSCDFAIEEMKSPFPFEPVNLGDSVNSVYNDYWPSISADEQVLILTSQVPIDPNASNTAGFTQEDFYMSVKKDGEWQKVTKLEGALNTEENEGAQSISVDGRILFFTACNKEGGKGRCDIYFSILENGKWSAPINIGPPINTKFNEKQPSIAPDGTTLYFVSNRSGGNGKQDIWKSKLSANGFWGEPENLGDSINTDGDEVAPFIHADNKTLYFTSNGHLGFGGNDVFLSKKNESGFWSKAKNLGYPINSPNNEMGLIVNAKGNKAYYAISKSKEKGLDLYSFDLPQKIRPEEVSYMKGVVYDADTKERLVAELQIIELKSGDTLCSVFSGKINGEYLVTIPTNNDYALATAKKGYLMYSDNFAFSEKNTSKKPLVKDIPLEPIKVNKKIVLRNIFYESDSYLLKSESKIELDKILEFLSLNQNVKIEIGGHTDDVGTDQYNMTLSQKRADEVANYLFKKGIYADRVISKGYGESQPLVENTSDDGRAKNRRTELKIIGL